MDASMDTAGNPENPANMPGQPQASAPPQMYGQSSGGALFKLKCIWLFILGAILSVIGLFCLLYRPDMGQTNPFIIMLMGLFFTAAGSVYGKRKLHGQAAVSDQIVDPQQMLHVGPIVPSEPQPQFQPQPGAQPPAPREAARLQVIPVQPQPVAAVAAPPAEVKIIKIFVCPKCGAENEMGDKFCYKCGTKFVKPKKRAAKKPKKPAKATRPKPAATKPVAMAAKKKPLKKIKISKSSKEETFA